jgi:putative transposase
VAVTVGVAANADGRREALGMAVEPSEAEIFWTNFLGLWAAGGCAA